MIEEAQGLDINGVKTLCNKYIHTCMDIERPNRDYFNGLCADLVKRTLVVPEETLIYKCKLVDTVQSNQEVRILPEDGDGKVYTFDDVDDIKNADAAVLKRRFLNSIVQGASYSLALTFDSLADEINKIDHRLLDLYKKIIIISDYILFNEEEHIDEKNLNRSAYVSVQLGSNEKKTIIEAQAIIFPYLLRESFRGFFELFTSHGLPKDNKKAMYLIRHADFMMAESWDLRFGVELWNRLRANIDEDLLVPYFVSEISQLPTDDFTKTMKEILSNTRKGETLMNNIIGKCKSFVSFEDLPQNFHDSDVKTVISDDCESDYFTLDELKNLKL